MRPLPGRWVYHRVQDEGGIVPFDEVRLPPSTQGLHYGTAAFEGIRAHTAEGGGAPHLFRVRDHYLRFLRSCRLLRIDVGLSADELTDVTVELLRRNGDMGDVYVRPLAYKLGLLPGTPPGVGLSGISAAVTIVVNRLGSYTAPGGVRCLISSWRRPSHAAIPVQAKVTGGYVNSALAVDDARAAGYDDAILLNDAGQVAEASTANVFAVRGGTVLTPPPDADILPGITRDTVFALAAELGLVAVERPLHPADLLLADEVFLTGTGVGVTPVIEINGRPIGAGEPGPITRRLVERYRQVVRAEREDTRRWLTPVDPGVPDRSRGELVERPA
ncbi:branched-chain amino acid transaminase [Sphaerisporangium perillae]|uniref:branched-chain amino acid transaminase n=1 Tax=Sphaerisporangium perillae TaxID=2935860 RepID=UPI00200ED69F|nr:branched-chain amino acid transaminase [Sphaerisporangium perillae]